MGAVRKLDVLWKPVMLFLFEDWSRQPKLLISSASMVLCLPLVLAPSQWDIRRVASCVRHHLMISLFRMLHWGNLVLESGTGVPKRSRHRVLPRRGAVHESSKTDVGMRAHACILSAGMQMHGHEDRHGPPC